MGRRFSSEFRWWTEWLLTADEAAGVFHAPMKSTGVANCAGVMARMRLAARRNLLSVIDKVGDVPGFLLEAVGHIKFVIGDFVKRHVAGGEVPGKLPSSA